MQPSPRHLLIVAIALVAIAGTVIFLIIPASPGSGAQGSERKEGKSAQAGGNAAGGGAEASGGTRILRKVTIDVQQPANTAEFISALRGILPDKNVHRARKALLDLMEYLTPESAPAVRETFAEMTKAGFGSEFGWWAFCTRWGEIDAKGAFDYFDSRPDDPAAKTVAGQIMEGWTEVDQGGARSWLAAHQDSQFFKAALRSYIEKAAQRDLSGATSDLFAITANPDMLWNTMGALVANARSRGQIEGVSEWFEGLNETQKAAAFQHAMWAIKDADLSTAVDWFTQNADKPWRDDIHFHHIASRYAQEDPKGALDWVLTLPNDPGRPGIPAGLSTIMYTWGQTDPTAASAWLDQHRDASWLPRAAMGYYQGISRQNPNAGAAFLAGLSEEMRQAVLRQLANK